MDDSHQDENTPTHSDVEALFVARFLSYFDADRHAREIEHRPLYASGGVHECSLEDLEEVHERSSAAFKGLSETVSKLASLRDSLDVVLKLAATYVRPEAEPRFPSAKLDLVAAIGQKRVELGEVEKALAAAIMRKYDSGALPSEYASDPARFEELAEELERLRLRLEAAARDPSPRS